MQPRIQVKVLFVLLVLISVVQFSTARKHEDPLTKSSCTYEGTRMQLTCSNLKTLQKYLDKSPSNSSIILVQNSYFNIVPGHCFIRFVQHLKTIDMHACGIEAIDPQAFIGLVNLEKLILWGNKINWIPAIWFTNLQNLRVLDLSFNKIQNIEYQVYQMLPNLESFFIDYNDLQTIPFNFFSFLSKLKKVKFGMNPLKWAFRVHLTWQLIYQKVDYQDDWENWDWFSDVVRECVETGQGSIPSDQVLDCVSFKLVDFASEKLFHSSNDVLSIPCATEVSSLLSCTNSTRGNSTVPNKSEGVRKALQGMDKIIRRTEFPMSKFQVL